MSLLQTLLARMKTADQAKWTKAITSVINNADRDTVDFIAEEIVNSGFDPTTNAESEQDDEVMEDAFQSLVQEHLIDLLHVKPTETIFISRDILTSYLYPPVDLTPDDLQSRPLLCELCDRPMFLTIHHLFPRSEHTFLLRHPPSDLPPDFPFTKQDLLVTHRAWLCRPCHSAVHRIKSNRELGMEFWSVERLLGIEEVRKWVGYAMKQKASGKNYTAFGGRYKK